MKKLVKEETAKLKKDNKSLIKNTRIMQAIFIGIFALGLSMSLGDIKVDYESLKSLSSFSLTTTVFGFMGALSCEWFARKAIKW